MEVVDRESADQKVAMMEEIRVTISDNQRNNVLIFYRTGAPIIAKYLDRVAETGPAVLVCRTGG